MVNYISNRRFLLPFVVLVLLSLTTTVGTGFAQGVTGTINGRIIERGTNGTLPGANVFLVDTRLGSATDLEGSYQMANVPAGVYQIEASFIGYKSATQSVTVSAGEEVTVNFELALDVLRMDEIVVTGTGTALTKKQLTTTIQTISSQDIQQAPVESIEHLLAGRLMGGQVRIKTGQPGTGATMRLRGITSTQASQTPVIYIDGIRVDNNSGFDSGLGGNSSSALSDIHIGDIEKVEITKSGAASTLYGSEAAAGVIQIFTKRGRVGAPKWTVTVEQGIQQPEEKFVFEDLVKSGILKTGYYQKYGLNVSGGSERVTYNLSGAIQNQTGHARDNEANYFSFNAGLRTFPTDKLQVDITARASRDFYQRFPSNNALAGPQVAVEVLDPVFTKLENGDDEFSEDEQNAQLDLYFLPEHDHFVYRYGFGVTATYDFNKYFNSMVIAGVDYRNSEQRRFNPIAAEDVATNGGGLFRDDREFATVTGEVRSTFKYPLEGTITSAFTFGAQGFRENSRNLNTEGVVFGLPGTEDFDAAANIDADESNIELFTGGFYFNEQIGLWDKLFLTLGLRVDGSSTFGTGVEFAKYPKAAIAYNISDESFWEGISKFINPLKLRLAYGETGQFPASAFARDKTFTQIAFRGDVAANFGNPGNPDLGPETTKTVEFGFDAAFFDNRIGFTFTRFDETTENAILRVPLDPSSGFTTSRLENVGEIDNSGIELQAQVKIINTRNISLDINGGYSTLHNEVVSLGDKLSGFGVGSGRVEVGHSVGVYRRRQPIREADGSFAGAFQDSVYFSSLPDKFFNVGLSLGIGRNFHFSVFGDGQRGGHVRNNGARFRYFADSGNQYPALPDGDNIAFNGGVNPQYIDSNGNERFYSSSRANAVWVETTDFFKIREILASYRLPKPYFGTKITINASIRNAHIFARNKTIDPELNGNGAGGEIGVGGWSAGVLSQAREWRLGLVLGF